jgi:hypothetical protein
VVPYVRSSFFAGERFVDRDEAQRRAEEWCATKAGMRIHGTTQCRPAELFALEEAPRLLPGPTTRYHVPLYAKPKVHPDHHIEVGKALYSVPGNLIGHQVDARADAVLVKVFFRGQLVKVHPRQPPGACKTDPGDLPSEKTVYADARREPSPGHGRRPRPRRWQLRPGPARHPVALDQDAPGLRAAGPG